VHTENFDDVGNATWHEITLAVFLDSCFSRREQDEADAHTDLDRKRLVRLGDDLSSCDYGDGCAKTLGSVIKFKLSSSIRIASWDCVFEARMQQQVSHYNFIMSGKLFSSLLKLNGTLEVTELEVRVHRDNKASSCGRTVL
jgi:hypothetical protein